jgi:hypothetical protein
VEEVPLEGGRVNVGAVVRVGDTVRRPLRPNSPFVHELLLHLEAAGFDGAPRFLGIDDEGREMLSCLPGVPKVAAPDVTDEEIRSVAGLLRRFHDAAPGVVHGDAAQWNVLWVDGRATALIDFDEARPGRPLEDVGYLAWMALRLVPAGRPVEEQRHRLALLAEAYGVRVDDALLDAIVGAAAWLHAKGTTDSWQREVLARIEGERRWLHEIRDYLL